jgi:hypothetical protein
VAYTLVDNCLILGIDPRRYLQDTIDKLERGHALRARPSLPPQAGLRTKPDSSAPSKPARGRSSLSGSPSSARFRRVDDIHANLPHAWSRRNHLVCKGLTFATLIRRLM